MLSFKSEIVGGVHRQAKYQGRIPLKGKYQNGVILRSRIPGNGYPLQIQFRKGAAPSDQIPGRRYPFKAKYQGGVTPPDHIPGQGNPTDRIPGRRYRLGGTPGSGNPFRLNTRAGPPSSGQLPRRCYPLEANFPDGAALQIKYKRNIPHHHPHTHAETEYEGGVTPSRSSTSMGPSHSDRIPGRGKGLPIQIKYQR